MTQELHGVISLGGTVIGGSLNQRGLKGETGDKGYKGDAATIAVGTTSTGAAGTNASVTNSGDEHDAVFDFTIPKGDKGETGEAGADGQDGADGFSPSASVSKVGDTTTITITDKDGTTTASVYDGKDDVFVAEYRVTTYDEIDDAFIDGKAIILKWQSAGYYRYFPCSVIDTSSSYILTFLMGKSIAYDVEVRPLTPPLDWSYSSRNLQETLVSGTSIKTINNESLLGSGNIDTMQALKKALPTDTASGAIASFPDGSDLFDYLSCIVDIEPVQDLHGYSSPWVGGAGKNKANIASVETTATSNWGVSVSGNVLTVEHKNTYSTGLPRTADMALKAGTYCISYTSSIAIVLDVYVNGSWLKAINTGGTFTLSADSTVYVAFPNTQATTITYQNVQLESGSTPTSYEPYENLCPITGWTGCEVDVSGVNLLPQQSDAIQPLFIPSGTQIFVSATPPTNSSSCVFNFYRADQSRIDYWTLNQSVADGRIGKAVTITEDTYYVAITNATALNKQIELGTTATPYTPYNGTTYPVSWQTEAGTVYGGTVDLVTGVLTVDRAIVDLGTLAWQTYGSGSHARYGSTGIVSAVVPPSADNVRANILCTAFEIDTATNIYNHVADNAIGIGANGNIYCYATQYATAQDFKTAVTGQTIVYKLATTTTYQLDPVQVACLLGQNNVFANCGNIEEVKYKADVQKWVEKKLGE